MESISKARIKFILSLQHKKFRLKYDKFIVEGLKIITDVLSAQPDKIEEIYISNPDYLQEIREIDDDVKVFQVSPKELNQLSQMSTPPGILAIGDIRGFQPLPVNTKDSKLIYLAGIRDPGNLGTIIRTMDWFGMDHVLVSPDCVDQYNHKVIQASMGSVFRLKFSELTWDELMNIVTDMPIMAADMAGISVYEFAKPQNGILVLGNEANGLTQEMISSVDTILSIPGVHSLGAESLNVASVAAIFCSWWTATPE